MASTKKKPKEASPRKYVLVEAIQQHHMRYVVELAAADPSEWALDDVTSHEVVEFSQKDLGESIITHRVLPGGLDEALKLAREDNGIMDGWPDDLVYKNHITPCRST